VNDEVLLLRKQLLPMLPERILGEGVFLFSLEGKIENQMKPASLRCAMFQGTPAVSSFSVCPPGR
jgi:hypothetical protein